MKLMSKRKRVLGASIIVLSCFVLLGMGDGCEGDASVKTNKDFHIKSSESKVKTQDGWSRLDNGQLAYTNTFEVDTSDLPSSVTIESVSVDKAVLRLDTCTLPDSLDIGEILRMSITGLSYEIFANLLEKSGDSDFLAQLITAGQTLIANYDPFSEIISEIISDVSESDLCASVVGAESINLDLGNEGKLSQINSKANEVKGYANNDWNMIKDVIAGTTQLSFVVTLPLEVSSCIILVPEENGRALPGDCAVDSNFEMRGNFKGEMTAKWKAN